MDPIAICAALSDATRLAIFRRLHRTAEPMCLQSVVEDYPQHYSVVTRHVGKLVECGLVKRTKISTSVFLRCNTETVEAFRAWLGDPEAPLPN